MRELLRTWDVWLSGSKVESLSLWGLEMLWWGRIGKLVGFIASLAVVAEIIGTERLRIYGQSLSGLSPGRTARAIAATLIPWFWNALRYSFAEEGSRQKNEAWKRMTRDKSLVILNIVVSALIAAVIVMIGVHPTNLWEAVYSFLRWSIGLFFVASPLVILILFTFFALMGVLIDRLLLKPLAWLLELDQFGRLVKISSVVLLAFGFHFDLLAS